MAWCGDDFNKAATGGTGGASILALRGHTGSVEWLILFSTSFANNFTIIFHQQTNELRDAMSF